MAAIAGVSIAAPNVFAKPTTTEISKPLAVKFSVPWKRCATDLRRGRMHYVRPVAAAPDQIEESIKSAQEACSDDPVSGECAAAWDEVEELSAAASHARDKKKDTDPLETYCKENPETDECRTYDN